MIGLVIGTAMALSFAYGVYVGMKLKDIAKGTKDVRMVQKEKTSA